MSGGLRDERLSATWPRSRRRKGALAISFALTTLVGLAPTPAFADEQRDLDRGRNAYLARQYEEADARFRAMLDAKTGTLHENVYVNQAYMYWGAVMVAKKRLDEAQRIFEQLILRDSTFEPDPLAFSTEVLDVFTDTRGKLRERLTLQAQEDAKRKDEERKRREDLAKRERERIKKLEDLASQDKTLEPHSRSLAFIPFGVGQFQNGKPALGIVFAALEGSFLAAGTVMYPLFLSEVNASRAAYDTNTNNRGLTEAERHHDRAVDYQRANAIFLGLFALTAGIGIFEANLNYVPETTIVRRRPVPPPVSIRPPVGNEGWSVGWSGSF